MLIKSNIFIFIFCFFMLIVPSISYSSDVDQQIQKFYYASDYSSAVRVIEQNIVLLKDKIIKGETVRMERVELYKLYHLLTYIYAWRLDKTDEALMKYEELKELGKVINDIEKMPILDNLYIGQIYEKKNDFSKAQLCYQKVLSNLLSEQEKKSGVELAIYNEMINLIKYQIDGLNLKYPAKNRQNPLLKKIKPSKRLASWYLVMFTVPWVGYEFSRMAIMNNGKDLADMIQRSTPDIGYMIINYMFILNAVGGFIGPSQENLLDNYVKKYPEGYYALWLQYLFYKFYQENGQPQKAEKIKMALDKISKKRGINIIIDPDNRFSSPQKTWELYRNAILEGNMEMALECFVLENQSRKQETFKALGKDILKEDVKGAIQLKEVTHTDEVAEFDIIRKEKKDGMQMFIRFVNIDGEWMIY